MPLSIGGVVVPWWVYGIIAIIIIIILYALYKNLTAYAPAQTAFDTTETPLPDGFDSAGQAANADSVLNEWFGTDDASLVKSLNALTDNELISVSNAYNDKFYSEHGQTLLTRLQAITTDVLLTSTGALRDQLVTRMQGLNIT